MRSRFIACAVLVSSFLIVADAPARADDPCSEGSLTYKEIDGDTLYLLWTGDIRIGMDDEIRREFDHAKSRIKTVLLGLSSCGGNRGVMVRTTALLKRIKKTHTVNTLVRRGATCASACIPIFLQGTRRFGALTSIWAFHETWTDEIDPHDSNTVIETTHHEATVRTFKDYYVPAGVSKSWIVRARKNIKNADWWQTGADLWYDKSRIITDVIKNRYPVSPKERRRFSPSVVCGAFCRG